MKIENDTLLGVLLAVSSVCLFVLFLNMTETRLIKEANDKVLVANDKALQVGTYKENEIAALRTALNVVSNQLFREMVKK